MIFVLLEKKCIQMFSYFFMQKENLDIFVDFFPI